MYTKINIHSYTKINTPINTMINTRRHEMKYSNINLTSWNDSDSNDQRSITSYRI